MIVGPREAKFCRDAVLKALDQHVASRAKFTVKSLEEVAQGALFHELRPHYEGLMFGDVVTRAKYMARNFIDTEKRNRRIFTNGKTEAYPLIYRKVESVI